MLVFDDEKKNLINSLKVDAELKLGFSDDDNIDFKEVPKNLGKLSDLTIFESNLR